MPVTDTISGCRLTQEGRGQIPRIGGNGHRQFVRESDRRWNAANPNHIALPNFWKIPALLTETIIIGAEPTESYSHVYLGCLDGEVPTVLDVRSY